MSLISDVTVIREKAWYSNKKKASEINLIFYRSNTWVRLYFYIELHKNTCSDKQVYRAWKVTGSSQFKDRTTWQEVLNVERLQHDRKFLV